MRTTVESSASPSDQCGGGGDCRRSSLDNYRDHRRRRKNQNVLLGPIHIQQYVFWNRSYVCIWFLLLFARWFWQCWTCLRIWVIARTTTIVSFMPIPMMMMMVMMIPLDDIGYTSIASVHGLIFTAPRGAAGRLKYCTPHNYIINKNCNNDNHMEAYGGYSIRQQQPLPSRLSPTAIFSSHKNPYPPNFVTSYYRSTAQQQPSNMFSRCWMMMVVPRSSMLSPPPSTTPLLRMTHHAQQHGDYNDNDNKNNESDNKEDEDQLGREELYAQRLQRQIAWLRAKDRSSRPIPVQVQYPFLLLLLLSTDCG
jgi:hypothetical protein